MPEGRILKFALVGCGRISGKHADAITNHVENAQLVAVCDNQKDRAEKVGNQWGVKHYFDYHEMMKQEDIDVVCILTPSGLHAEHTIDIARYGAHVVVEKPMALRLNDADRMIKECDLNRVRLFVVKQNRYNLPVTKLREALDQGRFGKKVMGTVRVRWCRHQAYYDQDAWRGTWAMDGGVFSNQASHHIDLLEWMMGDVESVMVMINTSLVDIECEDTGIALLRFSNGALGVIEATTATRPKDIEGSLSIMGEKGVVEIGGFAVNKIKTWQFEESDETPDSLEDFNQNPTNVYGFGHIKYLQNVVDAIIQNKHALVDGVEGRKSLELINALYESAETRKEVFLRYKHTKYRLGER
jgi:UDP-N-acetyl-2-amino-2-deoxyglucuronate dehydrogenase